MAFFIKIYRSYRIVVAICDEELIGKKFEEGKRQLDVRENFYNDGKYEENEATKILQQQLREDATYNIVGEKSIKLAEQIGIINSESIAIVQGIPFALKLL